MTILKIEFGGDIMVKVDGVEIREVDVSTPTIYSLQWIDEYARRWEVLIEKVGWSYLIRQVYVLDREDYVIKDMTIDPVALNEVKNRIKGFTGDSKMLTWNDFMVKYEKGGGM